MTIKYLRWCNNGCGKQVRYIGFVKHDKRQVGQYQCLKCNCIFLKEDLMTFGQDAEIEDEVEDD